MEIDKIFNKFQLNFLIERSDYSRPSQVHEERFPRFLVEFRGYADRPQRVAVQHRPKLGHTVLHKNVEN